MNENTAKTTDPIWDSRNSDEPSPLPKWAMTNARFKALMDDDELALTDDEKAHGYHFCHEFDGLLRTNTGEEFQCDCLKAVKE